MVCTLTESLVCRWPGSGGCLDSKTIVSMKGFFHEYTFRNLSSSEQIPLCKQRKEASSGSGILDFRGKKRRTQGIFIDNYLKPNNFIQEGFLQKNEIDYVGISANTICFRDTLRMLYQIHSLRKQGLWNGKIIVGGPHTSVALKTIPDFVDFVVRGEGEKAIFKIINDETDERVLNEKRIKDLDILPFQPWDIFSRLSYDYTCAWMNAEPVFTINTSRGCPFNCAFCSVNSIWGKKYTFMSSDRIFSEIEYLVKNYGAQGIYFREDNFTLNSRRVESLCRKLIDKGLKISWACETRVDTLTEELIKLMSRAGCRAFYLGVESGSEKVLKILNKGITIQQIENAILWSKKYNINTYCSLMTGIPGEDYSDYLMTKNLMRKLHPYKFHFNIFVGIPYSRLYEYILDNNLYEYIDDIGLLYLPGFDVKTKFIYGQESSDFVDYKFCERTQFDEELRKRMLIKILKKTIGNRIPSRIKWILRMVDFLP